MPEARSGKEEQRFFGANSEPFGFAADPAGS